MKAVLIFFICAGLFACTNKKNLHSTDLNLLLENKVKTLDPAHTTDNFSARATAQIYEGLYQYHYLKRPLTIEPLLAEGLPEISNEGKTYKIKIKKGLYFQNNPAFNDGKGREVTAEDFVYSWKRLAAPSVKAGGFWVIDGLIQGLNEWREKYGTGKVTLDTPVAGLVANDRYTLTVHLTKPHFQFTHVLATTYMAVIPREAVEKYGEDFARNPVGTGPFQLEKWIPGSKMIMIKNPKYHDQFYPKEGEPADKIKGNLRNAGEKLPFANKLTMNLQPERQPMWLNFMQGNLDHTIISKDNYSKVIEDGKVKEEYAKKGIDAYLQTRPDFTLIAFNMEHPVLGKNKFLRQAIASALNVKKMLEKFYNGRGIVAQGPIPPGIQGYDPNYRKPFPYDLEKAKKLMIDAGFPRGQGLTELNFELPGANTFSRQFGESIKYQLSLIGVPIKLVPNSWPQFEKKVKTKKADIILMAWLADYPDPENLLQLFYSKNVSPGPNMSNFSKPAFDRLFEKAVVMPTGPERTRLFRKMVDIVNEEVPVAFQIHRIFHPAHHGWLKNYKPHPIILNRYKYYRVDAKDKAKYKVKL